MPFVFDDEQDYVAQPMPKASAAKKSRFVFDDEAPVQPQPKERGVFEDFAQGGGRILTERGIGIIQLLDEATGGALLSPDARQASYKAMQNLNKEKEQEGIAGTITSFTADPLNALPFARGLKGAKALAASGAVTGLASEALRGKSSEQEDRLANTGLGATVGAVASPIVGKTIEVVSSPVQAAKSAGGYLGKAFGVVPESVKTFDEAGIRPILADVSKSNIIKRAQNMSEDAPLVGMITTSAKERMQGDVKNKLAQIGFDENAERVIGGDAAKQGLKNYVDKGKKIFRNAFDEFDRKFIGGDEKAALNSTTAKINEILSRAKTPEALDAYLGATEKDIIAKIQSAAGESAELPYSDLKLFRTSIGKKLEDYQIGSSDKAILRELYGSLTDDMRRKAMSQGEEALQAFDRLNSNYAKFTTKLDDTINEVLNKGETTEIFNAVRSGLPLPERTATIMRALPQKNRDIVRGSLIRELGVNRTKAGQGEFEVGKFVTAYNALDPKAQKALLIGLPADVQNNFRKVMQAATLAAKTGLQSNPSGTARNLAVGGLAALPSALFFAPITTTSYLAGGAITAKMMTSPRFIKWLANAPKQIQTNPSKYIARLSAIAASDEANREDIESYQRQLIGEQ